MDHGGMVSAAGIEPANLLRVERALCQLSYADMARLTGLGDLRVDGPVL